MKKISITPLRIFAGAMIVIVIALFILAYHQNKYADNLFYASGLMLEASYAMEEYCLARDNIRLGNRIYSATELEDIFNRMDMSLAIEAYGEDSKYVTERSKQGFQPPDFEALSKQSVINYQKAKLRERSSC